VVQNSFGMGLLHDYSHSHADKFYAALNTLQTPLAAGGQPQSRYGFKPHHVL
jgi:hypothetical protein